SSSPLIHADAEREAVSYGQLLRDVRAFASCLRARDRPAGGCAWVAVHDPYLLLVGVFGALGTVSCAMVEPGSGPADCDQMAASGARPTWCAASPALSRLPLRLAAARDLDWSRLRLLRSASSPLTLELLRELEARFEVPVVNAYVMTEAPGEIASQGLDRDRRP